LLVQLEDEGLLAAEQGSRCLSWDAVYTLHRSSEYRDAPQMLALPVIGVLVPALVSRGSLTDRTFSIGIDGWWDGSGARREVKTIAGPLVAHGGAQALLSESVWTLVRSVRAFAQRGDAERDELYHRTTWGKIRQQALAAGAMLDAFLYRTVVLAPERLTLSLRRAELSDRVVEVVPSFQNCPDEWLTLFDRRRDVPTRYDIVTRQGIVQVVVTPAVRTVLEEIKRMPGRRVAGARAEAFITNPFASLGEVANEVLDPEQFEQARAEARLLFERFTALVHNDAFGYPGEVAILIERTRPDSTVADSETRRFVDADELDGFIADVRRALAKGHQLCLWDGNEFELMGDTEAQVAILAQALETWRKPRVVVSYTQVYDLSNYSERIEGIGIDKPYYSPFIARPESGVWVPDEVQVGVVFTPAGQSEPIAVPLDARVRDELEQRVKEADAAGASTVAWSAVSSEPVPLADAKSVLDTLKAALADVASGTFDPAGGGKGKAERDETGEQQPSRGESLIIKANIQSVDYEEARRVALEVPEDLQPDLPSTLRHGIDLKEHQLKGVTWLQHLRKQCPRHCRGALLADDMGLGKTLQVLVTLAAAFERDPALPPALIVAPVSLLDNWKEEVHKFFQDEALPVLTAYGGHLASLRAARSEIDAQLQGRGLVRFLRPRWRDNARIVLTTYETLRDLEFSFASEKWSVMVCDEAQKVKNPNALVTRAV
jgi:hypothetical protein